MSTTLKPEKSEDPKYYVWSLLNGNGNPKNTEGRVRAEC